MDKNASDSMQNLQFYVRTVQMTRQRTNFIKTDDEKQGQKIEAARGSKTTGGVGEAKKRTTTVIQENNISFFLSPAEKSTTVFALNCSSTSLSETLT